MKMILGAAAALAAAAPASAEVVKSGEHGFEIRQSALVPLSPAAALNAFGNVSLWWNGDHTYSGKASNLSMSLQPGGCLCERLPDGGGIEHMRVTFVQPGKRLVLTGSLGPLLYQATTGVMDIRFEPLGNGSRVTLNYRVAGFANGGAAELAAPVDGVLRGQLANYVASTRPALPPR